MSEPETSYALCFFLKGPPFGRRRDWENERLEGGKTGRLGDWKAATGGLEAEKLRRDAEMGDPDSKAGMGDWKTGRLRGKLGGWKVEWEAGKLVGNFDKVTPSSSSAARALTSLSALTPHVPRRKSS